MSQLIILVQQDAPTAFMLAIHEALVRLSGLATSNLVTMAPWTSERALCIDIHVCTFVCA